MTFVKAPIFSPVYRNVDKTELTDKSSLIVNGYVDEAGYVVRFPGLSEFVELGYGNNPVVGLFWWPHKDCVIAVCGQQVFKITYTLGAIAVTNITTNALSTPQTPTWTIGVDANVSSPTIYGLLTASGAIIEGHGTGATVSNFATLGGTSPTTATHLAYLDGYILANDGSNRFFWCDIQTPGTWTASNYASAVGNPDLIVALKVFRRQIFLFGNVTTEIWENDGTNPFSRIAGGFMEIGCGAPYSVVVSGDSIVWLDETRHFVMYQDGSISKISTPYDRDLANFSSVSDCIGFRIDIDGQPFLIFCFHAEAKTLFYNLTTKTWSEGRTWNTASGAWERWRGHSYCFVPTWGKHLVGSKDSSIIYEMNPSFTSDAGQPIKLLHQSGPMDYGISARKRSNCLRFRIRRGDVSGTVEPKMTLRWNDDNRGWSNEVEVGLGLTGDAEIYQTIYPRGIFRTRQYEVSITDLGVKGIIGSAEEDIEVLSS